ncbi:MAG: ferrous iron transport protein A [Candidatus Heimdallarchaeota archaeon]|nr:ferrous iron transport protein A [Candidatus Heimdallarchaeota archaeon]
MNEISIIPLGLVPEGKKVRIVSLRGGHHLQNRISEMGLREGIVVSIIKNSLGPVIIALENSRFALGRGMSMKILTEPIN